MKFRNPFSGKQIHRTDLSTAWPPGHFYSPIPAITDIRENEDSIFFPGNKSLGGIDINEAGQIKMLERLGEHYDAVPFLDDVQVNLRFYYNNPNFSYGEAVILFCMISSFRPKKIVEIGSGYSSCVILDANEILRGMQIHCVFIEPYPDLFLSLIKPDDRSKITLVDKKVQQTDLELYSTLQPDDMLIVDSSHVVKTGGDVNFILFEILPVLTPGVLIHFHDIGYPFEYPKSWVYQGRAWNEAYFLRAFLQYNRAFRIEFYSAFMAEFHKELFTRTLPICGKNFGTSLWMKKLID
jgi:hypothetical protein